ncbi:MAG: radical SAM family heme chaperone HemW [Alphaproteobacteria bacterium]|nr:radical SAM family heme chaperone HemW [Alphaproteobacteria bacterium]
MRFFGLYIHWPFCLSKCPYCDFNSHVREKINQRRWKEALLQELESAAEINENAMLNSIFFGGGTPSLMEPDTIAALLEKVNTLFSPAFDIEVTLEANPSTVEFNRFKAFHDAGINRLSIGVQSLDDEALSFLGRRHSAKQALKALEIASSYFPRYSFDLIYARPDQTVASWKAELLKALTFTKGHLSLYQLTIEPQTVFATRFARGEKLILEDDPAATLYELTEDIMNTAGLPAYEVSNYAIPTQECRHNLLYWNFEDYIGIGPGAHGRITKWGKKWATSRYKAPETWLEKVEKQGHGLELSQSLSQLERLQEVTLMGLRLTSGLEIKRLFEETNLSVENAYTSHALERLEKEGLLLVTPTHITATFEGRLKLNSVIAYLLKSARSGTYNPKS